MGCVVECEREKGGLVGQAHEPIPSDANEEDTAVGKSWISRAIVLTLVDSSTSDWRCRQRLGCHDRRQWCAVDDLTGCLPVVSRRRRQRWRWSVSA